MKTRNQHRVLGGLLLAGLGLGACGSPPTAPRNPTWEADVYPILQGQCLHCHANSFLEAGGGYRFEFFDGEKCGDDLKASASSAWGLGGVILKAVKPQTGGARAFMPPVPASTLEDWQVETLERWVKRLEDAVGEEDPGVSAERIEALRGERKNNRNPRIRITSKLPEKVGNSLRVSFVVEDSDGDPVIGQLRLGEAKADITGAGAGTVSLENITGNAGDELTFTAELCDGWARVTRGNLGKVEKE